MNVTVAILEYETRQALASRSLLLYCGFYIVAADLLLRFSADPSTALLSLANLALIIVPLATIILGTMFVYDSREFIELLLSQPIHRRQLFGGLWLGLAAPMAGAFLIGITVPVLLRAPALRPWFGTVALLGVAGTFLTLIFAALAFVIAIRAEDRVRGMGGALLLWLFLAVVYDALTLLGAHAFHAWPLEKPLLVATLLNPVDLARVILMMNFDASALMAYTGSVFRNYFGSRMGLVSAAVALSLWLAGPLFMARRSFERKDF
jgi:Cu-processing system permease protein